MQTHLSGFAVNSLANLVSWNNRVADLVGYQFDGLFLRYYRTPLLRGELYFMFILEGLPAKAVPEQDQIFFRIEEARR